jgi:acyl-CoA reductase-like NAD-dependent aldehyde dehydrogenase
MANYPEIELYIGGRWKRASGQPVINPADESVLGTVPTATTADLDDALAAAERGFAIWRKTSPAKRSQIILKAASLIRQRVDDMAIAMTLEQGKPIDQARLEILRGCDIIEWDATDDELARAKGGWRIVLRLFDHSQGFGGNAGRSGAAGAGLSRRWAAARGSKSGIR